MASIWFGANAPFLGPGKAVMSRQEDVRLIQNDLLQLLFTIPGERVHRPDFGTPLRTTLFDQMSAGTVALLSLAITQAIADNEPRLINVNVDLTASPDQQLLNISITGQLTYDPSVTLQLDETIPLNPGSN